MILDLVQLHKFVAVAEEQHLTRAAERLHISQSAASAHVRAIEESFGIQLFARTRRGLELTTAGRDFLIEARDLLGQAARLAAHARELGSHHTGSLHVGCNSDPALSRVGAIVDNVRTTAPGIHLSLQSRTSLATRQGLRSGELDVGLLIGRPTEEGFDYRVLRTVTYRIAGPATWRERLEHADWAELARLPWLGTITNTLTYSHMLDELFTTRGLKRRVIAETDNDLLLRFMVTAGVGVSLVREDHAQAAVAAGLMALSPLGEATTHLLLAHLTSRADDPLVKSFVASTLTIWPEAR